MSEDNNMVASEDTKVVSAMPEQMAEEFERQKELQRFLRSKPKKGEVAPRS